MYRNRNTPQWSDGTVAYYIKIFPRNVKDCPRQLKAGFRKTSTCNLDRLKRVLCEEGPTAGKNHQNQNEPATRGERLSERYNSSVDLKHVVCPSGHWTHAFLSCDVQSACWQHDDTDHSSGRDVRGVVASPCHSLLMAMFSCRDSVDHVPYSLVCDHSRDCLDNSDEDFCDYPPCSGDLKFQCLNKQVRRAREGK